MSKTLSVTLGTVYSSDSVVVVAKNSSYDPTTYVISKRQLKAAERRIGMIKGDGLTMHEVPDNADYWTWHNDGSLSIKITL